MKDKKTLLILILSGALAAVILFFTCNKPIPPKPVIIPAKVLIKEVDKFIDSSKRKADSLEKVAATLSKSIVTYKVKLSIEQDRARQMEDFINNLPADSNKQVINDYVDLNIQKDSTSNALITSLETKIDLKDQLLTERLLLNAKLKSAFDTCAKTNLILDKYSGDLRTELKKKRLGNTFWKGVAIAAGLVILRQSLK